MDTMSRTLHEAVTYFSDPNRKRVRAMVVADHKRASLLPDIRQNVLPGSVIYTDALRSYRDLGPEYAHALVITWSNT